MYNTNNNFSPIPKGPHNKRVKSNAEGHAYNMRKNPSYLEQKMIEFLDNQKINYEFQKIIYIKSKGGFIKNYYIADFYIPKKKIVLEVDGKFHKDQVAFDEYRTRNIQRHYPKIRVVRWEYNDFHSYVNMKKLVEILK